MPIYCKAHDISGCQCARKYKHKMKVEEPSPFAKHPHEYLNCSCGHRFKDHDRYGMCNIGDCDCHEMFD